jgi:acyl transferase domain-containing protein
VVGHSLGEIAAAHAAGVLALDEALHMTVARARAMRGASGHGRMLAVELPAGALELARFGDRLVIAAINGPRSTVVSGEPGALEELRAELVDRRIATRRLRGELAFHSPQMQPARHALEAELSELRPRAARIPLTSTLWGRRVAGTELSAAYWGEQVVAPVRFADAIGELVASGHTHFVELGPHPVLCAVTAQILEAHGVDGRCLPTLRQGKPERHALLETLGALYVAGYDVDLAARPSASVAHAALPSYPWQRRRYWLEVPGGRDPVAPAIAVEVEDADADAAGEPRLIDRLAAAAPRTHRALLEAHLARRIAAILLLPPGEPVDATRGFLELGMDSLMIVRLRQQLSRDLARALPTPVVFDYPSIRRLAAHLAGELGAPAAHHPAAAGEPAGDPPGARPEDLPGDLIERELLAELGALEAGRHDG